MKKGCKIALVGGLAAAVDIAARWKWMIRMPLKEFTQYALYMAVLDNEICRNELEDNRIGDMEQRLQDSRQYRDRPREQLEVEFAGQGTK